MDDEVTVVSCRRPETAEMPYEIVFSNGEVLTFSEEEVLEYALYREGESCGAYEDLCTVIFAKRMMASVASYVLFSARTEAQVRKRLTEKYISGGSERGWDRFAASAIEEAIRRFREFGYLDDAVYCRKYISAALRGKPVSQAAILNELVYRKGIAKELAEDAVRAAYAENPVFTDDENACRLLRKKTGGRLPEDPKELAKLYRYLAGKGFSYHTAENAVRRIKEEEGETNA